MNIPDLFHSADEIFDSVIVTQRLGIKQKIHKQFQNFYRIGPIPFVWTFEEALHQALPCPFQDWINSLLDDDVAIADCLAMLPCMEQALRLCQEYGNSFNVLPFQINEHSVLAQKAWKLIRGVLNSKEGKFSSSPWNKIEFLKTNFTKIIFVDSLPHVRTPCLDGLRKFIQRHHTFVQHNSCSSSVWITKFNSLKDEAIGIVRFIQNCDLSKRIAIVSDDFVLLQNVEAYLNDLNILCRNKIEPSNFLDSTLGSFFLIFLNFLQNSCGATLEALLSHPFVQRIASQDFQQKSSQCLHSILCTESKPLGNRWIIKSEASLNDLQALASPDLSAWLSNLKWEEANIFKKSSFHLFADYFYYHHKTLLSFLNFVNSDFKLELQYTFPIIKKPVSQNDYKTFLKFFMKQNFMTFKGDVCDFPFDDSPSQTPVLLLSSQQALSYDFDIVCLGSLSEQSWYQSSPFMLLLPIFDLSQEQDIFDYCLAAASQVFLSYHEGESLIPSHLLDKYKNYPSQNFPCTTVSFAAKKSLSAKADVPVPLRPRELSVTDLQNLKDDPYAFYAKKILHLYPLATLNNDLGCWTHFVLDQFIRQKAPSLLHFAQQLSQGSLTLFRYYVQMHDFFLRLEEEIENLEETKILTEQKITKAVSIAEHSFLLSGRIDRIDIHKESVTLIDYKTGTSSKTDIQNCVKLQLPLEAKLWKDQYDNDTRKVFLHLISVKSQQTIIVDSDLLNKINKIVNALLTTYLQPDYMFETTINCKNRLRNYIHLSRISIE